MKLRLKTPLKAFAVARLATAAAGIATSIEASAQAARRLAVGLREAEAEERALVDPTGTERKPRPVGHDGHHVADLPPVRDPVGIHPVLRKVVVGAGLTRFRRVTETPFTHVYEVRP